VSFARANASTLFHPRLTTSGTTSTAQYKCSLISAFGTLRQPREGFISTFSLTQIVAGMSFFLDGSVKTTAWLSNDGTEAQIVARAAIWMITFGSAGHSGDTNLWWNVRDVFTKDTGKAEKNILGETSNQLLFSYIPKHWDCSTCVSYGPINAPHFLFYTIILIRFLRQFPNFEHSQSGRS
jgi:rubredoxin